MKGRKPNPVPGPGRSHHKPRGPGAMAEGSLPTRAPSWLTASEAEVYRSLVKNAPASLLKLADGPAVARLAVSLAAFRAINERLATLDVADPTYATLRRLAAKESELAVRLESELGIGSPTARRRVVADVPRGPEVSEFDQFLARRAT